VPFGARRLTGYLLARGTAVPPGVALKDVVAFAPGAPLFPEDLVPLYRWLARYYAHPLGDVLRAAVPAATRERRSRAALRVREEELHSLAVDAAEARNAFSHPGPARDRLIDWLARRGEVPAAELKEAFPNAAPALRQLRERGLVRTRARAVDPEAAERGPARAEDREVRAPTAEQAAALAAISSAIDAAGFRSFLLHGVTGSGKTEVYLQAAAHALRAGGSALLLVPEIGLTPQFLGRFRSRFGDSQVAVLHSALSERERFDEWTRIGRGEARLVVGARSAVFAPLTRLRLLVVDEEHDGSYKQEEGLRYHGRDVALLRAQQAGAVCILGSATPSLESVHLAATGRHELLRLPSRVEGRALPEIELVDLRQFPVDDPDAPLACLSPPLRDALLRNHEEGGQAILLLNRRGFATTVLCVSCGAMFRCKACDVTMTYHGRRHALLCHWCGASEDFPEACPSCSDAASLRLVGRGTERLEEEMAALWPQIRVDRMDADTTRSRSAHRRILDRFRARATDVLVGTQMVAKGHDFPEVTLVGVLHADAALHLPDFRASERTFQLIAQVAGRAGRGKRPGRVLVQTWHPEHHAIRTAIRHDVDAFGERELRLRRGLWYPPFSRLLMLRVSASDERRADRAARAVRRVLDEVAPTVVQERGALRLLGPAPAPIYRVRGRFRWQLLVKARDHAVLGALLQEAAALVQAAAREVGGDARVGMDRDPVGML
jgi:primosomal protein N' (replication factor Y)